MQISDIFSEARYLVSANSTSYPDANLLIRVNQAGEEVVAKFIAKSKKLKFDDNNNTDLPIGTGTLTDNRQDYALDSTLLIIDRVEIKDINGLWHKLTSLDENNITDALGEYKKTPGLPDEYSKRANSLFFYCPPSSTKVTLTNGLKIYYQRGFRPITCNTWVNNACTAGELFDGTIEPGFASAYHIILAYKAALPYANAFKKDRVAFILTEIQRLESEMYDLEANKDNDKISRMIANVENNK
jgi:hypothetical protein